MKKYKLICTFSHFGNKSSVYDRFKGKEIIIEDIEFKNTEDEHITGIIKDVISQDKGETLKQLMDSYFYHNKDLSNGECFGLYHYNTDTTKAINEIYNEDKYNNYNNN